MSQLRIVLQARAIASTLPGSLLLCFIPSFPIGTVGASRCVVDCLHVERASFRRGKATGRHRVPRSRCPAERDGVLLAALVGPDVLLHEAPICTSRWAKSQHAWPRLSSRPPRLQSRLRSNCSPGSTLGWGPLGRSLRHVASLVPWATSGQRARDPCRAHPSPMGDVPPRRPVGPDTNGSQG